MLYWDVWNPKLARHFQIRWSIGIVDRAVFIPRYCPFHFVTVLVFPSPAKASFSSRHHINILYSSQTSLASALFLPVCLVCCLVVCLVGSRDGGLVGRSCEWTAILMSPRACIHELNIKAVELDPTHCHMSCTEVSDSCSNGSYQLPHTWFNFQLYWRKPTERNTAEAGTGVPAPLAPQQGQQIVTSDNRHLLQTMATESMAQEPDHSASQHRLKLKPSAWDGKNST